MPQTPRLLLLAMLGLLALAGAGSSAEPGDPFKVSDPLKEKWWTEAETEAFLTNRYLIEPRLAAAIRRHAPPVNPDEPSPWNTLLQHVTNTPPFLLTPDLDALARATNAGLVLVVRQLSRHSSAVVVSAPCSAWRQAVTACPPRRSSIWPGKRDSPRPKSPP